MIPFDPSGIYQYGYGRYDNVITGMEIERMINASGPTQGHVMMPSNGETPKRVAFIHCVGSRDEQIGKPYCSRVCCMYRKAKMLNYVLITKQILK